VNLDLQKDIWQKGFNALAASAGPGQPAGMYLVCSTLLLAVAVA
jgi:hypothetical protein